MGDKSELTEAQNRFWYGYINNPILYDVPSFLSEDEWAGARELSNLAFTAGCRYAMRTSSELSPHIARFIHMLILIGYLDDEPELSTERRVPRVAYAHGTISPHPTRPQAIRSASSEPCGDVYERDIRVGEPPKADDYDDWLERSGAF